MATVGRGDAAEQGLGCAAGYPGGASRTVGSRGTRTSPVTVQQFRTAFIAAAATGTGSTAAAAARELATHAVRTVVLVEGVSDQLALESLAARRGRDLDTEGVCVVPMGGAMSIGRFLGLFASLGSGTGLRGLCDEREQGFFRRGLGQAGLDPGPDRTDLESLGFYVCVADLEDELIRSLGVAAVERIVEAQGDLRRLRTFQEQPAQRGRAVERQLHRFMGTTSGRKARYARLMALELEPTRVPRPLDRLLSHV